MVQEVPVTQSEQKEVTPTQTRILAEKENVPFHQQPKQEELIPQEPVVEIPKTTKFFDDTNAPIYGNDLDVPAFIRRQHD